MRHRTGRTALVTAVVLALPAADAWGHWCDDMWHSAYNLVVRPDSDTSPKELYVQNNMGYQLPKFALTATSSGGAAVTLTPPTTLKVAGTLLPGEGGVWKITAGNPARIEDLTFAVAFGDDVAGWTNQDSCYPLVGAKPVMVVKTDGSLYPPTPAGLDNPKAPPSPCVGILALGRSLIDSSIADYEDLNVGLDHLLQYFCSGRASWGIDDNVTKTYCKDTSSTTCPTSKTSGVGRVSDYVHLWAAGELAIRKKSLGARLAVVRERMKCAANDGDMGFAGFPLFVLGYLGDDAGAKSFLQTQASTAGDVGTIAKAALYMMGDTAKKADVQAGLQSSSVFVKAACAGALGIADKDDAAITDSLLPLVKWKDPAQASEDGKGMYAAHILEIVAFDRRGWVPKGVGDGPVTFYGDPPRGAGGDSGTGGSIGAGGSTGRGGASGNRDGGSTSVSGNGGATGRGGRSGSDASPATGGSTGSGGSASGGAQETGGAQPEGSGGMAGSGGKVSSSGGAGTAGGSAGQASSAAAGGSHTTSSGTATSAAEQGEGSGCKCGFAGQSDERPLSLLALVGLALLAFRRRRARP